RSVTFYALAFQLCSTNLSNPMLRSRNPSNASIAGLGCSRFARRYSGNRVFFLFLRVLRCFSSPGALRTAMYSLYGDRGLPLPGCPIRISADQGLLATPRSFSQLPTSFIGLKRLGIRHVPFIS